MGTHGSPYGIAAADGRRRTTSLKTAAFAPFEEDFKAILASYRALRPDVEALLSNPSGGDPEDNFLASVDSLLKRLYAYVSWGLLQQAITKATSIRP